MPAITSGTLIDAVKGNADFRTGSTEVSYDVSAQTVQSRNKAYGSSGSIRVYFEATSGKYIVSNIIGTAHRFPDGYSSGGNPGLTSYGQNAVDGTRRLNILTPSATNPKLALTYTSYGVWQFDSSDRSNIDPQINDYHFFYFGIPTPADAMPRTGSASYSGLAQGILFDPTATYALDGTMTLNADFAAATVNTGLSLRGTNTSNGLLIIIPAISGTATIGAGTNGFRGELTSADNSLVGSVQGAFFGPAAQEVGLSFGINSPDLTRIGGGAAVGKR
ncbi:hypothetical protein HL653_02680 [Sphingomonas sp. AP4-R1]|uniref:transferrin-binding protein-like solute binding protein n=1 Tax=Sphingomonas sp. AP4-R1 TaxID=2735134 RepID=UPI0014934735|nr:transferrin-binding protein-like solute binding protein [Sphingomonas sp. AP4-R1]QJU56839.1 hypothetical protein HL653_02680 [Sphingomonas sp. AP4-R1]